MCVSASVSLSLSLFLSMSLCPWACRLQVGRCACMYACTCLSARMHPYVRLSIHGCREACRHGGPDNSPPSRRLSALRPKFQRLQPRHATIPHAPGLLDDSVARPRQMRVLNTQAALNPKPKTTREFPKKMRGYLILASLQ